MKGFHSDWKMRAGMRFAASVALCWFVGGAVYAGQLFAGISGIEAGKAQPDGRQTLTFQSDSPFQYQMQIQDRNHIVLRLYKAQLAGHLVAKDGAVTLLPGGAIQSAQLRTPDQSDLRLGQYQEIILSGTDLSEKRLRVIGANEIPLTSVAGTPPKVMQAKVASAGGGSMANLKKIQTKSALKSGKAFKKLVQEPVSMMALGDGTPEASFSNRQAQTEEISVPKIEMSPDIMPRISGGPQISGITNVTGPSLARNQAGIATTPRYAPAFSKPAPAAEAEFVFEAEPEGLQAAISPAAPEPKYQVVTALPRYRGGAAPIQAMTTDSNGKTVRISPKNQPIPEFSVEEEQEGYNALFQAEPDTNAQKVSRLMADALTSFRGNQLDKALTQIQQALRLDAENADLYAALAEIQLKRRQPEAATRAYAQAAQKAEAKYGQRYAQMLVLGGKRTEALSLLEKLYRSDSKQFEVAYMLGTLYEEQGQTSQALPYLKQAADLHPASADIQYNLGLAYELSGDRLLAEKHYQQALRLNTGAADIRKALARVKTD